MKKHRLITVLAAALVGVSAAAFPPAAPEAAGSIVAEAASGDTFNYGNFEFTHGPGSNEATLTNYLGSSTTPSIPSQVYDWSGRRLTVKKIGEYAFIPMINGTRTPRNITAITIPSAVTEIGNNAFSRTPLVNITIPSSVGTIGTRAFSECTSLEYVRIEGSARIGANAFLNCTALHHVILDPDCFPVINPSGNFVTVFQNCTSLQMINDTYAYSKISVNGAQKPVLSQDEETRNLIRRFF
ncbi:MAG: leucine-rich repeat domain-containing protein, partial [Oscillospiraceae bacterium]|nr:leucine-rich repeat domain-containing protein [Oscillospiraceae bacterium]